ncbi:MAG: family 16 glycoside hydrolase, partial [Rubripirellula sp.]
MQIQPRRHFAGLMTVLVLSCSIAGAADKNAPENKPGYTKSKDVGAAAPAGADVPFDGTMKSIQQNWEMWPKPDMAISWSIVDNPAGDGKTLMTNGGKRWGTHDLVTKKKYTDFEGHVDFMLMGNRNDNKVDGYSNSGVYLQNRYELQIESPKGKDVDD